MAASANLTTCSQLLVDQRLWYVLGQWSESHFSVSVSDGARAWEGTVSADELDRRASRWDWTARQYIDAAVEHLREQQDPTKATYQLKEKDGGLLQLAWEMKQAGDEGVPLRGFINLWKADNPGHVVCAMMQYMHRKRQDLELELSKKTRAFNGMKEEAHKCADQARSFQEEKSRLESDLYKKFAAVLNTKKAKIRELKSKLADGSSLALVPINKDVEDWEASDREASGANVESEEDDEKGGPNEHNEGSLEESRRPSQEEDGSGANREPSQRYRSPESGAVIEEQAVKTHDGRGVREEQELPEGGGKLPVSNASALLGGGVTYTSGPRKRRR